MPCLMYLFWKDSSAREQIKSDQFFSEFWYIRSGRPGCFILTSRRVPLSMKVVL